MSRILRIVGLVIVLILVLLIVVVGYVFAQSNAKLNATHDIDAITFDIPDDEDTLIEGERIWRTRGCADCHAPDGGGLPDFINDPAMGHIPSSNITTAAYDYTVEDYVRAIQHGVGHDGRGLLIMPSQDWAQMREAELVPLVAYMLQLEPVERENPKRSAGLIGRALITFGVLPLSVDVIDHDNTGFVEIEAEVSVEFGEYLALLCTGCHGTNWAGQAIPGEQGVVSSNITSHSDGIGDWTLDDFTTAMRTGQRPDDSIIDALKMPWPAFSLMTDTELEAIYTFLQSTDGVAGN